MPFYRFVFGFESPRQFVNNELHGWDDEDSQMVVIEAADEASALAWRREIAERFSKALFEDDAVSWKARGYESFAEALVEPLPGEPVLGEPVLALGQMPDFEPWLQRYRREK